MKYILRFFVLVLITAGAVSGMACWPMAKENGDASNKEPKADVPYKILSDDLGSVLTIGLEESVTEDQLRATLVKAANEHQDDPARDYLTSMFLSIDAYLVRNGNQSKIPAGQLKRRVPPGNPRERKKMSVNRGKDDSFTITLDAAKRTLP